ncbi:PQQ-binding-like beta-propeller repeat protein [Thermogutta sp.]|uniref:outer membrane protein assembly factor BamB family protein n=1 Tax=Thermogutta sp. TaxID=1962930 RepID=UPI0032201446
MTWKNIIPWLCVLAVAVSCQARREPPTPAEPGTTRSQPTAQESFESPEKTGQMPSSEETRSVAPRPSETAETLPSSQTAPPAGSAKPSPGGSQAYWPRFHGPRGDNLSDDKGLLAEWPQEGPPLAWKTEGIGQGYAGVTIADGRIFTAGNIDKDAVVTALDMEGRILWQKSNGPAWTKNYPGARGTPTIDGDRVYHLGASGDLTCYRVDDGTVVWHTNIMERYEAPLPEWGLAESVLVRGKYLYCTPGGPKTCIVCLDKMTGETVWQSDSANGDTTGYASIQWADFEGIPILLTMTAKALVGVHAETGRLLFRHPHETAYDVNAFMPLYADGEVFVSTGYGSGSELVRLKREGENVTAEQVWVNKDLDNHHGGVILVNGFLYGSSYNGRWCCIDWKTGETRYMDRGIGKGSLTYADGMLYMYSERRTVGLVKATPEKYELVSQFRLPSEERAESWAHPVVCGGRLYLRHGNNLFAYDVRNQP